MERLLRTPHNVALLTDGLYDFRDEAQMTDYGMVALCRKGTATLRVNFGEWRLGEGAVFTLFPNDIVEVSAASEDFSVQSLRYDAGLLREASLQVEHTVYSLLRTDCCHTGHTHVTEIAAAMFAMLDAFFNRQKCRCREQMTLLLLQTFFLGYHDVIQQTRAAVPQEEGSPRTKELFNNFMKLIEENYKSTRTARDYAALLHITPKYLSNIVRQKTGLSPKVIINHFVTLQIKLSLRRSHRTIREMAWEYHFKDDAFFCHYFKRQTGISPQQYRKMLMQKETRP